MHQLDGAKNEALIFGTAGEALAGCGSQIDPSDILACRQTIENDLGLVEIEIPQRGYETGVEVVFESLDRLVRARDISLVGEVKLNGAGHYAEASADDDHPENQPPAKAVF